MKKITVFLSLLIFLLATSPTLLAQKTNISRVEPLNWWANMNSDEFQILVYGNNIGLTKPVINSKKVSLLRSHQLENPNYIFLDIKIIDREVASSFKIEFKKGSKTLAQTTYNLELRKPQARGFSSKDLIYLVMPDRFSNGDPSNDTPAGILEKADRNNPNGKHGGDLKGVENHLDYIKELGATALWLNPILENNMPDYSYHGYSITDFYKTDPRSGTNKSYKKFVQTCHKQGLKVIQDMIFNHCGSAHWMVKDLPSKDWFNSNPDFRSNFRGSVIADPHASKSDQKQMTEGWFVATMPDFNQRNPLVANYLIQNSLWWIEYAGIDAIRMDTQPYPFKEFMADWGERVMFEYPNFTLLGETWLQKTAFTAYFQSGSPVSGDYDSHLQSTTDFPLYYATKSAFNEDEGWTSGLLKLYYTFAEDFLYNDANNNVIFLDNHDLDRFYTSVGEDINKYKMGVGFLLTTRGIPMVYYATEILMPGHEHKGHGHIRKDFPGGWAGDKQNAFTKSGRTKAQNEAFDFMKKIANWRKTSKPVTEGKMMHFLPENNTYVYFRYTKNESVMVVLNNHNTDSRTIKTDRFNEIMKGYSAGFEIISGKKVDISEIKIPKKSIMIIELKK